MTIFIRAKLKKPDGQTNIDKHVYSGAVHEILKFNFLRHLKAWLISLKSWQQGNYLIQKYQHV